MKALIEQYLSEQGIIAEPYKVQFLRFTTKLYKDENDKYCLEFPMWRFNCPKPKFTHQEIESFLNAEKEESKNN